MLKYTFYIFGRIFWSVYNHMAYDLSLLLDPFLVILTTFRLQSVKKSVKMQAFLVHRNNQKLRDKRYKWKHFCVKLLMRQPNCTYRFNWYSLPLPLIVSYFDNDKLQLVCPNWKQDFQCSWRSFSCHFNTGSG